MKTLAAMLTNLTITYSKYTVRSAEATSLTGVKTDLPGKMAIKRRHTTRNELGGLKRGSNDVYGR